MPGILQSDWAVAFNEALASRLGQVLPTVVSVLLLILVAFTLADGVLRFWPQDEVVPTPAVAPPAETDSAGSRPQVNTAELMRMNLFGQADARAQPGPRTTEEAPDTRLNLTLRGIFAQSASDSGIAIIQKPGADERFFKAGGDVFGMARLEEIYADRIVLERNGKFETLRLPENKIKTGMTGNEKPARAVTRAPGSGKRRVDNMMKLIKDHRKKKLQLVDDPWQILHYEGLYEKGKVVGLRLDAEEEAEFLALHGLQLGDVIRSINGNKLDGGMGLARAVKALSQEQFLELGVERNGEQLTISIRK